MAENRNTPLREMLEGLTRRQFASLDFIGKGSLTERVISLALGEETPSDIPGGSEHDLRQIAETLRTVDVQDLRVVALGGGTGLSRIVGDDSRRPEWKTTPFTGLKEVYPKLHSIVCVTDDGGSTGEMLKDFPLISLGDLRRVLLSSVRSTSLKKQYMLDDNKAVETAAALHSLFNCRFTMSPESPGQIWSESGVAAEMFPAPLAGYLSDLVHRLFADKRMKNALRKPQCVGNLLIAAAVYGKLPSFFRTAELIANQKRMQAATMEGISDLAQAMGAGREAVLPCTLTSAQLQVLYANGVLVTGESKAGSVQRGYPVERVMVRFADEPHLPEEVAQHIRNADIIIMAPGSLYTSIIPVLQVPGFADLIRENSTALKLLVANIWVQQGETDATLETPEKKFHVSDLIQAYEHNISGGTRNLFSHVLTVDLADIPGSVLQNYAIEKKEPIYVDSTRIRELGFEPVQTCIFSRELLRQRNVIQHDPVTLTKVVRILWGLRDNGFLAMPSGVVDTVEQAGEEFSINICTDRLTPCMRYEQIRKSVESMDFRHITLKLDQPMDMKSAVRQQLTETVSGIIWCHPDIHPDHLRTVEGICLVSAAGWKRCQQWDNIFSFYDPEDGCIKIRRDQAEDPERLEMALLVALGQSLLGNYCLEKHMDPVVFQGSQSGRIYWLTIRPQHDLNSFLSAKELDTYLQLSRMHPATENRQIYARLVNGEESFRPPGLLFGLFFAWYLDNRFAPNIDYMMSLMKSGSSDLLARQVEIVRRREALIRFFREIVFRAKMA